MFKKTLSIMLFSCYAFGAVTAQAADEQRYTIDLIATIPADTFQVVPVESGWINELQEMPYDLGTNKLLAFTKQFQYKNTSGGIQATLSNTSSDGKSILSNGTDAIPLAVSFNGVKLGKAPVMVVSDTAARGGGRTNLRIEQESTAALDVTGTFTGQVAMIFEPTLPPVINQ